MLIFMYSDSVRAQVFEVIVRQAMAGAPWREICAAPMRVNNITPEDVEKEVERRLYGYRSILSAEEQEKLESYVQLWKNLSAGEKQDSSSDCVHLINEIYKQFDLDAPEIVICESPVKLFFFFSIIQFIQLNPGFNPDSFDSPELVAYARKVIANFDQSEDYEKDLLLWMKGLPASLLSGIGKPVTPLLKKHYSKNFVDTFDHKVLSGVDDDLLKYTSVGLPLILRGSLNRLAVMNQLVLNDISTDVIELLGNNPSEKFFVPQFYRENRMVDNVVSIRGISYRVLSPETSPPATNSSINGHFFALWAETELIGLNLLVNVLNVVEGVPDSTAESIANICELLKVAPWYSFFEKCCIMGNYSFSARMDDRLRLHGTEKPAITFSDGYEAWAMNGLIIPRAIARNPDSLTVNSIDNLRNIEVRRMLIENYGADNYLMDSGAEMIHEDEYGALFRKEFDDDEPLVMVRVTNSTMEPDGTFKNYFLRVPPQVETAREAVAWTFGIEDGQEYKPAQES